MSTVRALTRSTLFPTRMRARSERPGPGARLTASSLCEAVNRLPGSVTLHYKRSVLILTHPFVSRFKCPNPLSRKNPEDLTWRWRGCSQPRCPRSLTSRRGCQGTPARSQCPRAWCRRWAAWFCPLGLELICISSSSNLLSRVPGLRLS